LSSRFFGREIPMRESSESRVILCNLLLRDLSLQLILIFRKKKAVLVILGNNFIGLS
jgi:hypothetical protein